MTHAPATARALLASALSVTALLTTAACSAGGRETALPLPAPYTSSEAPSSSAAPAVEQPTPAPVPPVLSEEQVRAALITEADLGEPWVPTRGAATWRDGVLKATTRNADCRRLLDALYTEELFGAPTGPHAVVALDDSYNDSQLRYQVSAHRPADVDRVLAWLGTLPEKCERFTATSARAGVQDVEVEELPLPEAGDARLALRVTMAGETADGEPTNLTVDVAAVRVGENTITLTNGGFGAVLYEVTRAVAGLGADRLSEIGRQARVRV
ncbi:hypothetical protein [Streptomyces griseomycini]|uniref:Secreted protein n=1 Tax=Streptomyces griseomycini TaxID=66895 RepID=A0A7W7PRM4_9ACTN|nr:hypothetical protein [Streptomyces griseomycini]MBB4898040.1 hypothetical protein [Streptomyces griseomycini]GGQ08628.1 hypothetical protein GCM10010266_34910 [Streptomyces griseomycini]GGR32055.1 hypothetical protein GCM10015536_42150 [Streptomyces griseomycini]